MEGEKLWVGVELGTHASSVFALWGQQSCNQSDSGDDTSTTSNCWYISMTMAVIQEATGYQFSSCTAPPKTAAMYLIEKHPRDRPPSPTTSCRTHRQQCLCPAEPEVAMTPTLKKNPTNSPYHSPDKVCRHGCRVAVLKKYRNEN